MLDYRGILDYRGERFHCTQLGLQSFHHIQNVAIAYYYINKKNHVAIYILFSTFITVKFMRRCCRILKCDSQAYYVKQFPHWTYFKDIKYSLITKSCISYPAINVFIVLNTVFSEATHDAASGHVNYKLKNKTYYKNRCNN